MHFHPLHVTWTYALYTHGIKSWKVEGESPQ